MNNYKNQNIKNFIVYYFNVKMFVFDDFIDTFIYVSTYY